MQKLLITGTSGFLGWNLAQIAAKDWQVYGTDRSHPVAIPAVQSINIDLTDSTLVKTLINDLKPDAVIHTAAQSQPNFCEKQPDLAYQINVVTSLSLAQLCGDRHIPCIFTSTDLVFDGLHAPYRETDPVSPVNRYGEQKVEAEQKMRQYYPLVTVCRMPLMFGVPSPASDSFIQPFLRQLRSKTPLRLFTDEYRTPVSATTAARGLLLALSLPGEILHLGGRKRISRYEFGKLMAQIWKLDPDLIQPCLQKDVIMAAPRPVDVSLNSQKAYDLGYQTPPLKESLFAVSQDWEG